MKLWLVLDVGNTHTVAGIYQVPTSDKDLIHTHPIARVRFRTDSQVTADEYRMQIAQLFTYAQEEDSRLPATHFWQNQERVIVSTVVPALETVIARACREVPLLSISSHSKREFELDLPSPESLGADRLANVAGALVLTPAPFLIVDAGTATTFCLVDSKRKYIGGAITPGIEIGWKALSARAAKLFSVDLIAPTSSIGNTTETQLQSGVLLGYEALIEGLTDRLLDDASRMGGFDHPTLYATGGCMRMLKLSARFRVEPDLTLLGLLRYGQLNVT